MENFLNRLARKKEAVLLFQLVVVLFFFAFILIPTFYIMLRTPSFSFSGEMQSAIFNSFAIAITSTLLSIIAGVPMAWMLERKKFPCMRIVDVLVDMPLIVPTSALGFSVAMFWGAEGLGLLGKGFWLIVALHTAFVYPYIVRTVAAAMRELNVNYEIAGRSLGAYPLTMFRTITLPLVRSSVIIGALLAFTRSLGETGATMMVAGAFQTSPTLVLNFKDSGDMTSAVGLSVMLIIVSTVLLALVKYAARRSGVPIGKIYPGFEKYLSGKFVVRDIFAVGFLILGIIIPSFFFIKYLGLGADFNIVIESVIISFAIAAAVTAVNLLLGIPMAIMIARGKRFGLVFDFLTDAILVMPTVALGVSLSLFWGKVDEVLIIALAHLSFTYPFIIKPVAEAVANVDVSLEEAARSLGAKPIKVFRTITLPLIWPSIAAGALMAFMRSLSETGATLAISKSVKTIPVLIVDLVKKDLLREAAFACAILFIVSFAVIFITRRK
ncbi:MAG: ABC transporter permease subunit [Candidatus Micrarchaeota archaeon]|nr:ABC transporter permease subunit [Candidatus Micrarchaeota archaeon]